MRYWWYVLIGPFTLGILGWGITIGRCAGFGFRSDLSGLRASTSRLERAGYRLLIGNADGLGTLAGLLLFLLVLRLRGGREHDIAAPSAESTTT